jgi:hypothetical protein
MQSSGCHTTYGAGRMRRHVKYASSPVNFYSVASAQCLCTPHVCTSHTSPRATIAARNAMRLSDPVYQSPRLTLPRGRAPNPPHARVRHVTLDDVIMVSHRQTHPRSQYRPTPRRRTMHHDCAAWMPYNSSTRPTRLSMQRINVFTIWS